MLIFPGNALSRSIASLAAVTLLLGSTALPLPALAFSQLNPQAPQTKDAAQPAPRQADKPIEQALEAPANNALPMPDPLINKQAGQG
ncbi:MAG: hypothetical protein E6Q76_06500, partial [Rhizobium sp.]